MPRILKKTEIDQFHGLGYLRIDGFFYPNEVKAMSDAALRIKDKIELLRLVGERKFNGSKVYSKQIVGGEIRIEHVNWCGAMESVLMHYGTEPRLTRLVSSLLENDEADHLINQIHYKNPGDRMEFPFHQDCMNRRYGTEGWKDVNGRGSYVAVVAAIDEMTPYNGPLLFSENPKEYIGEIDKAEQERHRRIAKPVLMNPGDIIFIGPYLIHGSFANKSKESRRVLINGFSFPGANLRKFDISGAGQRISLI